MRWPRAEFGCCAKEKSPSLHTTLCALPCPSAQKIVTTVLVPWLTKLCIAVASENWVVNSVY